MSGEGPVRAGVRVAVVGCGRWGRNHVRNYAELGALAGVVDHNAEHAAERAAAYGVPVLSLDQALADRAINGIVLALPPSQNLPIGRRVIEAGKHLFVEKPMALSVRDGEELAKIGDRHGRPVMVGHILQYHPAFTALSLLAKSGTLGSLLSATSTRLDLGRIRREEDALWALAPHDVSMILGLFGAEPGEVRAVGGFHSHRNIADSATVGLAFAGGATAEIRVSWLNPFKEQKLVVVGRDAMAVFDDRQPWEGKLRLHLYRVTENGLAPVLEREAPVAVQLEPGEPLRLECEHFLDCIWAGSRPRTDGEEGLRVLRVLEAASRSLAAGGSPVSLP